MARYVFIATHCVPSDKRTAAQAMVEFCSRDLGIAAPPLKFYTDQMMASGYLGHGRSFEHTSAPGVRSCGMAVQHTACPTEVWLNFDASVEKVHHCAAHECWHVRYPTHTAGGLTEGEKAEIERRAEEYAADACKRYRPSVSPLVAAAAMKRMRPGW